MLFQIKTINGQKTIVPLTTDAGAGNPVGTIIPMYKKSSPSGYLYCDGSTFDANAYPLLYAYLGSNVLPDYRECVAVGAEQNTTDTIVAHDVYTEGQFKDDQLQEHSHDIRQLSSSYATGDAKTLGSSMSYTTTIDTINQTGRYGTTTHGKQKAVYFYIKATSGLSENAQDNVINTLNEQRSYSTEEHLTGKKWIDGKPIYSKTVNFGALPNNTTKTVAHNISNLNEITKIEGIAKGAFAGGSTVYIQLGHASNTATEDLAIVDNNVNITTTTDRTNFTAVITLEYTKTN